MTLNATVDNKLISYLFTLTGTRRHLYVMLIGFSLSICLKTRRQRQDPYLFLDLVLLHSLLLPITKNKYKQINEKKENQMSESKKAIEREKKNVQSRISR